MARSNALALTAATIAASVAGALAFRALHLPLAAILGSLVGATLVTNTLGPMPGGWVLRRGGQLFVGASVGAVLSPDLLTELVGLLPLMVAVAAASNLMALVLAWPLALISGIDRLTATLCSLPAGMAEMGTLAQELKADEQAVALVHMLRVVLVLTIIPIWLGLVAQTRQVPTTLAGLEGLGTILVLAAVAGGLAMVATRMKVVNAFVVVPMLLCLAIVGVGHRIPPVPPLLLLAAQIAIGTSLGMRFRLDRLRRLPRVALGGFICGLALIGGAFFGLAPLAERVGGLDHVSTILAVAPGGLGEMIASASTSGLLVAAVAGFQLTRSIATNLLAPPVIRWILSEKRGQ